MSKMAAMPIGFTVCIYIFGVITEKPFTKPLECNVVYIPILTVSHATSHNFSAVYNLTRRWRCYDITGAILLWIYQSSDRKMDPASPVFQIRL